VRVLFPTLLASECYVSRSFGKNIANPSPNRCLLRTLLIKSPIAVQSVAGTPKVNIARRELKHEKADGTHSTMVLDISHGGGSRITNQDRRIEDQQLPALNASALTLGLEGGNTFGGGHDGGDAHDPVQSGRSGGKFWRSGYTTAHIDYY
jgi:hypothetical protein